MAGGIVGSVRVPDASSNRFVPPDWQRNREALHGVEPADVLLAQRDAAVEKLAPLFALYGPFGTAEHTRKTELARCRGIVQAKAVLEGERLTQDDLDMRARLHDDYLAFITQMTVGRADWFRLDQEVKGIEYRLNRGQALLKLAANDR